MSTHTPGPWTIEPDAEGEPDFFSIWYDVDGMGAEIAGRIGEEANARLIAESPALLGMVMTLLTETPLADDEDEEHEVLARARALVARHGQCAWLGDECAHRRAALALPACPVHTPTTEEPR